MLLNTICLDNKTYLYKKSVMNINRMTKEEKQQILEMHKEFYKGHVTGNINTNKQPVTLEDLAGDKEGITIDNKGNVGKYRNHKINESKEEAKEQVSEFDFDVELVDLDSEVETENPDIEAIPDVDPDTDNPYKPKAEFDDEDFEYSDDSYDSDIDSITSTFDFEGEDDEIDTELETELDEKEQCEGCGDKEMYEDDDEIEEDEFSYAAAKARMKGKKSFNVGKKKFPTQISKKKAKKIVGEDEVEEITDKDLESGKKYKMKSKKFGDKDDITFDKKIDYDEGDPHYQFYKDKESMLVSDPDLEDIEDMDTEMVLDENARNQKDTILEIMKKII